MQDSAEASQLHDNNEGVGNLTSQEPSIVNQSRTKTGLQVIIPRGFLFVIGLVFPLIIFSNEVVCCFGLLTAAVLSFLIPNGKWFLFGVISSVAVVSISFTIAFGSIS